MSGIKLNLKKLRSSLRGPWEKLKFQVKELAGLIQHYYSLLASSVPAGTWDRHQLYYTAKALALYRLMTGEEPKIEFKKRWVYLKGINGDAYVPYRSIKYRGPFTRGYRYIKVDLNRGTYKIIKVKKKKVKPRKENETLDKFFGG